MKHRGESPDVPLVDVPKHLVVQRSWSGRTALDVVRHAFPEVSAREVFRQARLGQLRRNRKPCRPLDELREGDVLTVTVPRPERPAEPTVQREQEAVETPAGPFWIVREDEDLLAVSKPAGCASHPAARHKGDTLIERVRAYLGAAVEDRFQPALANRLDIDTSGLVLIAKRKGAQRRLGRSLQKGRVHKSYLALVGGWPAPPCGEIRVPLVRRPDSRELARYAPDHPRRRGRVQEAHTQFRTLERTDQPLRCALLEITILTGRTHQIRRHMEHIGHPVAGDRRYGDPDFNRDLVCAAELHRMFLHAHRVELDHPGNGEPLVLEAPLTPELAKTLRALGAEGASPLTGKRKDLDDEGVAG